MINFLDRAGLDKALTLLDGRLCLVETVPVELVVCGGAALLASGLAVRTTRDVDVLALMNSTHALLDPDPLPSLLLRAADEVKEVLGLPDNWLNNGPSRGEGGLYRMGLPEGLAHRAHRVAYGDHLTVWFIDRFDQIHLKLYAAVDQGGRHVTDLLSLSPTDEELVEAGRWAMTHDVSDPFREVLRVLLRKLDHGHAADQL